MEARILRFPAADTPVDVPVAVGSGALPRFEPLEHGAPLAEVVLGFRRLVHPGVPLTAAEESSVKESCVRAAIRVLVAEGARVRLAGSAEVPVVEATFEGPGAEARAARVATAVDDQVRRAGDNEFVVSGAVATGSISEDERGVIVLRGAPGEVAAALCEKAAPGQILLGGEPWESCRTLDLLPARSLESLCGSTPVFVLRGCR